jgi:hypothetical protein
MLNNTPPVLNNEEKRISSLSSLDLDYSDLENNFNDLTKLAAQITGSSVSLINLIDSFTQWTVSKHGVDIKSMPREESVCQYTIANDGAPFEVKDLKADDRFIDKFYVARPDGYRYYMGVPLKSNNGSYIGALCVLDTDVKDLSDDKVQLLKIIANEIVNRLEGLKKIHELSDELTAAQEAHKSLARDVREPLAGIIGILEVIDDRGNEISSTELVEYINLIQKSSNTILALTDAVWNTKEERELNKGEGNLVWLKNTIENLYGPQCRQKGISLFVTTSSRTEQIPFLKDKVLQITSNLIAYAIKNSAGDITVDLTLKVEAERNVLLIEVEFAGTATGSDDETAALGKQALGLAKELVSSLNGSMEATIAANSKFSISIPQRS